MSDNVTVYNGRRYREVRRKANVGELVKVVDAKRGASAYENGEIINVIGTDGGWERNAVYGDNRPFKNLYYDQYVVLELVANTAPDSLESRVARLEDLVDRLTTSTPATPARGDTEVTRTREQVIEMARHNVEAMLSTNWPANDGYNGVWFSDGGRGRYIVCHECRFVVNRDKRTVVALISTLNGGAVVWRGKARACDGDCFNADIGRAISLRRALGLYVPDYYTNAPQPTLAKVGDVVIYHSPFRGDKVCTVTDINGRDYLGTWGKGYICDNEMTIVDDSGEEAV